MVWSQLKKRVQSKLADSVRRRFDFHIARYADSYTMCRAWICIDGHEIFNMSTVDYESECCKRDYFGQAEYEKVGKALNEINIFSASNLTAALFEYLNLSMGEILNSANTIIRAFGMLDDRLGKRRLRKIDISNENSLVIRLYLLRCDSEGLIAPEEKTDLTALIPCTIIRENTRPDDGRLEKAAAKLAKDNKNRNVDSLLLRIYENTITKDELLTPIAKALFSGFENSQDRSILLEAMQFIEANTKLFDDAAYINAIIAMTKDCTGWIRSLNDWKPKSHNRSKQFASLARHLWAGYEIPVFMDKAWLFGNAIQQQWYKDIGAGRNIRNSSALPIRMTRKMAHHFLSAPDDYSIDGALRWGQVHSLGGDRRLSDALLGTRLAEEFRDDDFWLSVIRFFIRNPMLDTVHIGPIIDYIWDQKYENRVVFVERGVAEEVGPAQPNFSMRGRTVDSLLKAVGTWHRQLRKETKSGSLQWQRCGINEFSFIEGTKKSRNMKVWRIRELLSSQELILEGRRMFHCVASYTRSCSTGRCSIWSLDVETEEGCEKLLTIEVSNSNKTIRQVRGKRNRLAADNEKTIIKRWADREDLMIPEYLL